MEKFFLRLITFATLALAFSCTKDSHNSQIIDSTTIVGSSWERESYESWKAYTRPGDLSSWGTVTQPAYETLVFISEDTIMYSHTGGHNNEYSATYSYTANDENSISITKLHWNVDKGCPNYTKAIITGETIILNDQYVYKRIIIK